MRAIAVKCPLCASNILSWSTVVHLDIMFMFEESLYNFNQIHFP